MAHYSQLKTRLVVTLFGPSKHCLSSHMAFLFSDSILLAIPDVSPEVEPVMDARMVDAAVYVQLSNASSATKGLAL